MVEAVVSGTLSELFTWRTALMRSDLPPTARHVGHVLSCHMNESGGSCFPSVTTVMEETGLGRTAVKNAIAKLEEEDYLLVERPAVTKGRGHSNRYTARFPEGVVLRTLIEGRGREMNGKGSPGDPESVIEDVKEHV